MHCWDQASSQSVYRLWVDSEGAEFTKKPIHSHSHIQLCIVQIKAECEKLRTVCPQSWEWCSPQAEEHGEYSITKMKLVD